MDRWLSYRFFAKLSAKRSTRWYMIEYFWERTGAKGEKADFLDFDPKKAASNPKKFNYGFQISQIPNPLFPLCSSVSYSALTL
jgi:hypothetical protein